MKRWIPVLAAVLLAFPVFASEVQTLIDDTDQWWFYFKPEFKLTRIEDTTSEIVGFSAGPALNHEFYCGVGGYALVNSVEADGSDYGKLRAFDLWYVGLALDYTFLSTKIVHPSASLLIGGGAINVQDSWDDGNSGLFVVEPGLNLMLNISETVELGVGGTYRFMNGSDSDAFKNSDISGWGGNLFLRWTEMP